MAELRERPYSRFNFLVDIGTGETDTVQAGFMEVTGLGAEVQVIEYRAGNHQTNAPIKISGLTKVSDVVLRRGVIGSLDLFQWFQQVQSGDPDALRTVTIQLLSESRQEVAQAWRLTGARPAEYRGPDLSAQSNEVAIEELVLSCEGIESQ